MYFGYYENCAKKKKPTHICMRSPSICYSNSGFLFLSSFFSFVFMGVTVTQYKVE